MNSFQFRLATLALLGCVAVSGCDALDDHDCYGAQGESKRQELKRLKAQAFAGSTATGLAGLAAIRAANPPPPPPPFIITTPPPHSLPESVASDSGLVRESLLKLTVGPVNGFAPLRRIPSYSSGKFIVQTTVRFSALNGLTLGQSGAGLRFEQPDFNASTGRFRFLTAIPDSSVNGFRVRVIDDGVFGVNTILSASDSTFSDIYRIDLRIEQTATELRYLARPASEPPVSGGWTTVHTESTPPEAASFTLAVGTKDAAPGAAFYFSDIALDGDAIGGVREYPVIVKLRDSIETIRAAQAKLRATTPDFAGAVADLDTAHAASDDALAQIGVALRDQDVQRPKAVIAARDTLTKLGKDFDASRAVLVKNDTRTIAAQLKKLDTIALKQNGVITNMLGFQAPPFAKIPTDLVSLRVPN